MRKIRKIIVHCTATPEGREVSLEELDHWHRERGFKCIGYHYVVGLDGTVHEGRKVEMIGAHCLGYNRDSIGVAYVGGIAADGKTPADTRTEAQCEALRRLMLRLKADYPGATVHSHYEFAAKACPCFDAAKEYG